MKLKQGIVSRDVAMKLSPAYVKFVETHQYDGTLLKPFWWDWDKTDKHGNAVHGIKKGMPMMTYLDGQYVMVTVSSVNNPMHDADGPIVRVSNGEYSWRVDGDKFGVAI